MCGGRVAEVRHVRAFGAVCGVSRVHIVQGDVQGLGDAAKADSGRA